MRVPNWLKTKTRLATDETVQEMARVRLRLAKGIKDLEAAVSSAAQKSGHQDAD